jgi:HEAT repeat protein
MSSRLSLLFVALLAAAALVGCAVDPIEKLQDQLDSQQVAERQDAVTVLTALKDERSVELLIETLEGDPELLEQAGNALVTKGRDWEHKHPNAKKSEQNPVIEKLGATIADMHLEAAVRAKACWILGEIGSRRAIAALKGRQADPNSMTVRTEATTALNKIGSTGDASAMEVLADGTLVKSYDPEKRGLVVKSEAGKKKPKEETTADAESETKEEAKAGTEEETKSGTKSEAKPEVRPETKPETKPAAKT